jgi:uncharacterized protein DUF3618
MDQAVHQIETQIDRTRQRLGTNLRELEDRVDAATDWREHFRTRPYAFLGMATAGGVLLAAALRPTSPHRVRGSGEPSRRLGRTGAEARAQAVELWDSITNALLGVATTRIKAYIGELIPGFEEQFRRSQQRSRVLMPERNT